MVGGHEWLTGLAAALVAWGGYWAVKAADRFAFWRQLEGQRLHYGLAGLLFGWAMPEGLRQDMGMVLPLVGAFLGLWYGMVAGIDLDRRVLQRRPGLPLLFESGQISLFVAFVLLTGYAWVRLPLPFDLAVSVPLVAILCGICLMERPFYERLGSGSKGGQQSRNWTTTLGSFSGILLVALGAAQVYPGFYTIKWAGPDFEVGVGFSRVVLGFALGALIGLLADLSLREEWGTNGIAQILVAASMIGGGVAASLGLEPLWVGWVAGAWLINATLRRLDVLDAVERGHAFARTGLQAVAGAALGVALHRYDINLWVMVWVLLLATGVRVANRWGGLRLKRRMLGRRAVRDVRRELERRVLLEDGALAAGLGFALYDPGPVGDSVLAALFGAQWVLAGLVLCFRALGGRN